MGANAAHADLPLADGFKQVDLLEPEWRWTASGAISRTVSFNFLRWRMSGKAKGRPSENWMRDFHASPACLFAFVKLLLVYTFT